MRGRVPGWGSVRRSPCEGPGRRGAEGRAHSRSSRNTLSVRSVIGGCTEIPAEVRLTRKPQLELFGGPAQGAGEGRAVREGGARRGEATSSVDLPTPPVLTVGELARRIRGTLEGEFGTVHVRGEISNLRRPTSGHLYFCLKDESAQIRAVLFRGQARLLRFRPDNGQEVIARGRITFYEAGGDAQIVCDSLEPVGAGALALAFEQLKQKLAQEGLFDPARKKPIPFLPLRIGVVTSPTGAAIRDFLHVLHRRFPGVAVTIAPSRVQGEGAAEEIARGIRLLDDRGLDVIVVTRGGGSIEDLWAFNEEVVARAIAAARTPVVSAVGHEVDFTIADFVADLRAPTPTAAAELLAPVEAELRERLATARTRLQRAVHRSMEARRAAVRHLRAAMGDPGGRIAALRLGLDARRQRAIDAQQRRLGRERRAVGATWERLRRASPTARLQAGRRSWRLLRERLFGLGGRVVAPRRRSLHARVEALRAHDPRRRLLAERARLAALQERLAAAMRRKSARLRQGFEGQKAHLGALSPLRVLGRGYAIAFTEAGRVLRSVGEVRPGQRLHVELAEGALTVEVVGPAAPRKARQPDEGSE